MWCCLFFLLFFMCVCVICTFRSFSVSLCLNSDWQLQSCSLRAAYLLLHASLFLSLSPSFPHFALSLTSSVSPAHKLSFSCQTVIDMFLYLQQSALHFHHKTHMLKHFYNILKVPLGKFAIMIKNSQKGLVKLKQANYIKISIKIKSKFIDQIQNVAEVTWA